MAMSDDAAPKTVHQFEEEIHALAADLNAQHKQLHALSQKLDALERELGQAGFRRVKMALRDAYANITEAGQALVKAHMNLNVPPGAWEDQGEAQS